MVKMANQIKAKQMKNIYMENYMFIFCCFRQFDWITVVYDVTRLEFVNIIICHG